ncbi:MAG: radical SAM protein [Candidatus Omnitrophica bacterium]|nr:radical SAM protein [Candidatus Omnitrophota bacterium]
MINVEEKIALIEKIYQPLWNSLEMCILCPRQCKINRLNKEIGFCGMKDELVIFTAFLHKGEEPPISGENGSGTIFFSGCNLKCIYCQNYTFSHNLEGEIITIQDLAKIMVNLQNKNAHNINLVTPTHFLPHILKALLIAFKKGLRIPIVYNTSGYEMVTILEKISGIVDIYLADMKYIETSTSKTYSFAEDYPKINQLALKEMAKQVKEAKFLKDIMLKGLIVRHLIIPGYIEEAKRIITWINDNLPYSYISIMTQYQPYFKAKEHSTINRTLSSSEYTLIKEFIENQDIKGWLQQFPPEEKLAGVYFKSQLKDLLDIKN